MDIPNPFNKDATIFKLMRIEMYYLGNSGWVCYCGTVDDKFWAHKDDLKNLMSQRDAMAIQRKIDGF
jgi:hypothetical protein